MITYMANEKWNTNVVWVVDAIRPVAPINPMITPVMLSHFDFWPKNEIPINRVNSGVSEFNIPARELSITVCALANKNAGMAVPIIPEIAITNNLFDGTFFSRPIASGSKTKNETTIRNAPTTWLEYTANPLLISINELPQIRTRTIRINQDLNLFPVSKVNCCV